MARNLVIVESPSKAKTIKKYLGSYYIVKSSVGHLIDLPKSRLAVDLENNFEPDYITVRGKSPLLNEIKTAAKKSTKIFLATDPDREGEAIAWHLSKALKLDEDALCRVEFNEVTEKAVKEAIKNPRTINKDLVDAQQARRVLDRIVGYKLSPLLWKKVKKGLSAGRVQSIALKLVIDKEKEIDNFNEEEYWLIKAVFSLEDGTVFEGNLVKKNDKKIELTNETQATEAEKELNAANAKINKVVEKEKKKNPSPPFITSTLQQRAASALNFTSKKTMQIAQQLYEGVDLGKEQGGLTGLITYMRTDSTRISPIAKEETKEYIKEAYGKEYLPLKPRYYKLGKKSQDAHEAIRPSSVFNTPTKIKEFLSKDQFRLYDLIWRRFLASEMPSAIYDQLTIEIAVGDYLFRSVGSKLKFPGFLITASDQSDEEKLLPEVTVDNKVTKEEIVKSQHFTQPPAPYSESSLIKKLELLGIGRPSTYASILDTILKRGYIMRENKQLFSTELGCLVSDLLDNYFKDVINVKFTSELENKLDLVAEGKRQWQKVVGEFYDPFAELLAIGEKEIEQYVLEKEKDEVTDIICERCGRNMVIKNGRYGKFLACPGFPECRNTKVLVQKIGVPCPNCKDGEISIRRSKKGRVFYGCTNYPECETSFWYKPNGRKCPECGSLLLEKGKGIACSNSECKYKEKKSEENEES